MKLSNETLTVLKNFSSINTGIFFKQGSVLSTVSPQKNILADAQISENIPQDFGIYDLNNFLSVIFSPLYSLFPPWGFCLSY